MGLCPWNSLSVGRADTWVLAVLWAEGCHRGMDKCIGSTLFHSLSPWETLLPWCSPLSWLFLAYLSILCPILVSRDCVCLLTKRWTPPGQGPAFLSYAPAVPVTWSTPVSPSWTHQLWEVRCICYARGEEAGRRSRENRDSVAAICFRAETCSEFWRFHSTLFIWKKSTFCISPLTRRNPTLGGSSFQSHVLLALVILAHSGLRSQLGIVGPNRSLAPEMLWNFYKVSSEAGD